MDISRVWTRISSGEATVCMEEHIEPCGLDQMLPAIYSDDPQHVIAGLKSLSILLDMHFKDGCDITGLAGGILDLVMKLYNLWEIADGWIEEEAQAALTKITSICPATALGIPARTFCDFFLENVISDPHRFQAALPIIENLLNWSSEFKLHFLDGTGVDLVMAMPPASLPECVRAPFAGILTICVRNDFPGDTHEGVFQKLIDTIMQFLSPQFSEACIEQAARGCYYFVTTISNVPYFTEKNYHMQLVEAWPALNARARTYAVSTIGQLYVVDETAMMLGSVPTQIFQEHLECESEDARIDTAIALRNVFSCRISVLPCIYSTGILQQMIVHMQTDIYSVVRELVVAFASLIGNTPPENLQMMLIPELFETLEELYSTGDTKILRALYRIATCFCGVDVEDGMMQVNLDIWLNETYDDLGTDTV